MYRLIKRFGPYTGITMCERVGPKIQDFEIQIELASHSLNNRGVVADPHEFSVFHEYAHSRLSYKDLTRQFSFPVTSENLARHFFDWIVATQAWPVVAVRVWEADGSTVSEYRRQAAHGGAM